MPARACDWESCDRTGTLVVYTGDDYQNAQAQGWFCVGHAAIVSSQVDRSQDPTVWLDWSGIRRPGLPTAPDRQQGPRWRGQEPDQGPQAPSA